MIILDIYTTYTYIYLIIVKYIVTRERKMSLKVCPRKERLIENSETNMT